MFKSLFPKEYEESVYAIDFDSYYKKGFRGVMLDIDNTLVKDNAPADARAKKLIKGLKKAGFMTCILSNSDKKRVKKFAKKVDSKYVCKARKPLKRGYIKGMKKMGTDSSNTMLVGDQIFTDILGANNAGIFSILTKVLCSDERGHIRLKRVLEFPITALVRSGRFKKTS